MKLQINVENLPKRGETIELVFNKEDVYVDELIGDAKATMRIDKNGNIYNVKGEIDYSLELTCSRCLDGFELNSKSEFDYEFKKVQNYLPGYQQSKEEKDDEEEEFIIRNNIIDFERLFHDLIILSVPMKPLCRDDCRGLCPICGTNLNKTSCEHVDKKNEIELV